MYNFFILEGGYLAIALFILGITLFVATRDFMPTGATLKWMIGMSILLGIFILAHYLITTNRMKSVHTAFDNGKTIICESRARRKVSQSIDVKKSREWTLENGVFKSPNYDRVFHSARCIVK